VTWPYGNATGFFLRFPKAQVSTVEVNSFFLIDASAWVDERLSRGFVVPFSSNNYTAQRLTYAKALHLIRLRTINSDDSKEIGDEVDSAIAALLAGSAAMIQIDPVLGSVPLYMSLVTNPGDQNRILTGDDRYAATFGLVSPLLQYPDANREQQEVLGRPSDRPDWTDNL